MRSRSVHTTKNALTAWLLRVKAEKSRLATKTVEDLRREIQLNAERGAIRQQEKEIMEKVTEKCMN